MRKNQKGFSLVELIIVIAIMAVLIGLLAPQYMKFVQRSRVSADMANAVSIADAVNAAIAEAGVGEISSTLSGSAGDSITGISGLSVWPDSKVNSSQADWVVQSTSDDGVTEITLNGIKIYPGSGSQNAYYVAHYR